MEKMKRYGKQAAWILVALAVVITAVVALCRPENPGNAPQQLPGENSAAVDGAEGGDAQVDNSQLPEEAPDETVSINQGTNTDPDNLNSLPIKQKLTWEAINSFPIKYADMPIAERRQLCVDFFNFSKTALWTPKEDLTYYRDREKTSTYTLHNGTIYGGQPYVTVSSGNVYRLMDFIDESTGVVDVHKYMAEAPDATGAYSVDAMKYFGGQCSYNSYWGWARVINSATFGTTYRAVPILGFIMNEYPSYVQTIEGWTSKASGAHTDTKNNTVVNTINVCNDKEMGEQKMYQRYADLKLGDGLVYITSAGHFMMCTADAHVEYESDGVTINGDNSYILTTDQTGTWLGGISPMGDWYQYEEGVNAKKSFKSLFEDYYVTFTFSEFNTKEDGVTPAEKLDETWASFSYTGNTITKSQLFASSVSSNYGISDTHVIVTNAEGKEVYRHIVRAGGPSATDMPIAENNTSKVSVNTLGTLTSGTYNIEVVVQLGTGERPTVYTGTLKV